VNHVYMDVEEGCFVSCASDFQVRTWSAELDLWGAIDQENEVVDKKWFFPKNLFNKKHFADLEVLEEALQVVNKVPNGGFEQFKVLPYANTGE